MPPTAATPPLTIDAILDGLRTAGRRFPRRELQAAVAQQEAITPHLIRLLEDVARDPQPFLDDDADFRLQAALHLLAQFRETRACRAVVDLFALPADTVDLLLGETLTERGEMILAGVCGGNPAPIQGLVENTQAYEFVRTAALRALLALVAHGQWPREAAVDYFRSLLTGRLERERGLVWSAVVSAAKKLHPAELLPEIRQAYDDGLVLSGYCGDLAAVEVQAAREPAEVMAELRQSDTYEWITDVIDETEDWATFNPDEPLGVKPAARPPDAWPAGLPFSAAPEQTARRPPAKADKSKAKAKRKMAKAARRGNR